MNLEKYDRFLVLDLEATCCDRQTIPSAQMEIIEIGAVMLEAEYLTPISEFQTFVKPVLHPVLTEFCQRLTSITQDLVDNAPSYHEAIARFKAWLYQYDNFVFGSWGDYDRKQFDRDSRFHQIPYPISSEHINLKKLFTVNQSLQTKYGMSEALKLAGIELLGTHHRGIDDARNIARLMPYILGRKKINNSG
jgi:inhibitor of KinA sporulation pathway (predicted exonuclease)